LLVAVLVAVGGEVAVAAPTASHRSTVGGHSAGDPYFPRQGNGGYDVHHYALDVRYHPNTKRLHGVATITAVPNKNLTSFSLDLRHRLTATHVKVNGTPARHRQPAKFKQELIIHPKLLLKAYKTFTVVIHYGGKAKSIRDPDGALDGWIHTDDGVFVASEPQGSPTWFPVNDTPDDKATYRVATTVPKNLKVIGNGALKSKHTAHGRTTWTWAIEKPISSYLVTATIGKFTIKRGKTPTGIPYFIAVDPQESSAFTVLKKLPAIVDFFSRKYGKYPFGQTGAIVDSAHYVGYALETATRPLFDRAPSESTLSHELAHQWFGDTVTLARWRDIWLNEGFAQFSSWLWEAHTGGMSLRRHKNYLLKYATDWNPPPGNPGSAAEVFANSVYDRGACALEALREKLGSTTFFKILRNWVQQQHKYGNATVHDFISDVVLYTGKDLGHFFHRWIYKHGKP
jgi:aminopeptidase N